MRWPWRRRKRARQDTVEIRIVSYGVVRDSDLRMVMLVEAFEGEQIVDLAVVDRRDFE